MGNYITLIGAEDVVRAGNNMNAAADNMARAASSIEESLSSHHQWADEWLTRLEQIMKPERERGE